MNHQGEDLEPVTREAKAREQADVRVCKSERARELACEGGSEHASACARASRCARAGESAGCDCASGQGRVRARANRRHESARAGAHRRIAALEPDDCSTTARKLQQKLVYLLLRRAEGSGCGRECSCGGYRSICLLPLVRLLLN
eukprot:6205206-Pleurochrysis_carterae.AAC.2